MEANELRKQYYNTSSPQSLAHAEKLKRAFPKLSYNEIANWLMGQRAHTEFVQPKKKILRRLIVKKGVYETISADLADYQKYKSYNSSFAWLFILVCNYSKKLFMTPIKTKSKQDMLVAFEKFFDQVPKRFKVINAHSDRGTEYTSVQNELKEKYGVNLYFTKTMSPHKAAYAERVIQTVGRRIYRLMEISKSLRWIDFIEPIQKSYNNSWHSGLPRYLSPNDIVNDNDASMRAKRKYALEQVAQNKRVERNQERRRKRGIAELRVGDSVRIIKDKNIFDKSYPSSFSKEIYKINRRKESNPPVFYVGSLSRPFYLDQLSKVVNSDSGDEKNDKVYFVASVRHVRGRTLRSGLVIEKEPEYLVRARNDSSFSHWLTQEELDALKRKVEVDESILVEKESQT